MKEKYYKNLIFSLPILVIILVVIASYDWAYLSCLMENNDIEDTASYCYMSSRAIGYENLP